MVRRPSRGFTLVELLVVITIIGILMALLLPAVNFAVENARQRSCMNNMRQMALACVSFDSSKNRFPGYTNKQAYAGAMGTEYRQVSWFVEVTPRMERSDIYEAWQASASPAKPYVDFAVCPSDPPDSNDQPYLAYVSNNGFQDASKSTFADGIMHNHYPTSGAPQAITATQIKDGLTNTLLLSENIQASRYDVADQISNGFIWWETDVATKRINGGDKNSATAPSKDNARPSSNHPGGVNVAFADGHMQWLRQDIDYKVYVQLMTTRHTDPSCNVQKMAADPGNWKTYVLSEADYK